MLPAALLLAAAWFQAPAATTLAERLGQEGALENDTDLGVNADALAALAAGDAALAKAGDESARLAAFEHWRRALALSTPLDAVMTDARRATSVDTAARERIVAAGAAEFAVRFEGLATGALAAAGANEAALARVAHENPFTRAGRVARVRLCDAALERGATAAARAELATLELERAHFDASTSQAFDARRQALEALAPAVPLTPSLVPARTLALAHSIEFGPLQRANADRMLEPGFAVDLAGRTWIQSGERLLALERDGGHALFDPEKLVHDSPIHGAWLPAFGDADRPWPQRPALAGRTLALVLGRARETRGNALAGFDVGRGAPRLAWLRHDAEHPDDAVLPGRLEFQPGPLIVDGLVLVQVLQWQQDGTSPEAQHVDGRNTRAWLAALDAGTGRVVWKRLLGKGADRRARALERTDPVRATSVATLPLALAGAAPEVVVATEIGAAARVSVRDGRLRDAWRLKRVPHDAAVLPGSGGPWVSTAGRAALAPADADEFVYVLGQDPLKILRVPGLECLLGLDATGLVAVARADERSALARVEIASGARTTSLPFARGADWKGGLLSGGSALVAAGDGLALYDAGLALRAVLPLPGLEDEHHVGVWANGSRVLVAGEGRLWIVRVE